MKLKFQKHCENSKGDDVFSDVLCLSRPCLEAIYTMYNVYFRSRPCVLNASPAKAKYNYLTNTPKSELKSMSAKYIR